jgi:hypothetical protein
VVASGREGPRPSTDEDLLDRLVEDRPAFGLLGMISAVTGAVKEEAPSL